MCVGMCVYYLRPKTHVFGALKSNFVWYAYILFAESFFGGRSFLTICDMPSLDNLVLIDFCVAK